MSEFKLVLGLEIHLQLNTATKMFCRCDAHVWQAEPNTHTCPVCLGLPGALPVPNFDAVAKTQMLGLSLNSRLNLDSRFDRKHYFYPDLPKGYQISQYDQPLCVGGYLDLHNGKRINLERIHLEEDTAKSTHDHTSGKTLIDFNTSGMPLVEIVTKPDFTNSEDAAEFGREIQKLVRFLDLGDVDMEKGQMRLEPNISVRTQDDENKGILPNYKVEIKNINSFKFMEKAINTEFIRQSELLVKGETPIQENRGYREDLGATVSQRSKEDAHDYRYFPEPDIPPMVFTQVQLDALRENLLETPHQIVARLQKDHNLTAATATSLVHSFGKEMVVKFEQLVETGLDTLKVANSLLNKKDYRDMGIEDIKKNLETDENMISDESDLSAIIEKVIKEHEQATNDFKAGNDNSLQFLIGMVMKESKGKADAKKTQVLLRSMLR